MKIYIDINVFFYVAWRTMWLSMGRLRIGELKRCLRSPRTSLTNLKYDMGSQSGSWHS